MHYFIEYLFGLTGAALCIIAFLLLNAGKLQASRTSYQLLNLIGSLFVIISLAFSFNLASFILELVWAIVAGYGLVRIYYKRDGNNQDID